MVVWQWRSQHRPTCSPRAVHRVLAMSERTKSKDRPGMWSFFMIAKTGIWGSGALTLARSYVDRGESLM